MYFKKAIKLLTHLLLNYRLSDTISVDSVDQVKIIAPLSTFDLLNFPKGFTKLLHFAHLYA